MKNQSGTIKTNLELDRVVMGGSGGYRRLPGGMDHFSLQTHRQTDTHHNIYQQHHHRRHFPARHSHYHHNHNHHHHNHHDFVFTSNFRHISKLPCFFLLILTFSIIGPFSLSLSMTMFYDLQLLNVRLTKPDNSDEEQRCSKLLLLSQINSNKMKTSSYPV